MFAAAFPADSLLFPFMITIEGSGWQGAGTHPPRVVFEE